MRRRGAVGRRNPLSVRYPSSPNAIARAPDRMAGPTWPAGELIGLAADHDDAEGATSPEPLRHQDRVRHGNSGAPTVTEGECVRRAAGCAVPPTSTKGAPPWPSTPSSIDSMPIARFDRRHIGPQPDERDKMLAALGLADLDELVETSVPAAIRQTEPLDLPPAWSESQTLAELRRLAAANRPLTPMIGLGYYGTITPSVIRRNVLESPAWYTAYTPYQPEISQGRLEALLNFQTMVSDLTGLPTSGASLLDEATAVAEAMTLARRSVKTGTVFLLDADTLPQTVGVVRTRAAALGLEVVGRRRPADRRPGAGRRLRRAGPDPGCLRSAGRDRRARARRRAGPRAGRAGRSPPATCWPCP